MTAYWSIGLLCLIAADLSTASPAAVPAYGSTIREDNGPLTDGLNKKLSPERRLLVLVHAVFGVLAWLFFAPIAIIIARYFKSKYKGIDGRMWFRIHFAMNSMTVVTMILTFVLGYYAVVPGSVHQFTNPHLNIGTAVFAATCVQALLGILNHYIIRPMHYTRNPIRTPFPNKLHILLGWFTWGLGLANIPIGMVLYGSPVKLFAIYGVYMTALLLFVMILEAAYGRDRGLKEELDTQGRIPFQGRKREERSLPSSESVLPPGVNIRDMTVTTVALPDNGVGPSETVVEEVTHTANTSTKPPVAGQRRSGRVVEEVPHAASTPVKPTATTQRPTELIMRESKHATLDQATSQEVRQSKEAPQEASKTPSSVVRV